MPTATVILREGKSYTYPADGGRLYKFTTDQPVTVEGDELIKKLEGLSMLAVERHKDAPAPKLIPAQPKVGVVTKPPAKPAPAPKPVPAVPAVAPKPAPEAPTAPETDAAEGAVESGAEEAQ